MPNEQDDGSQNPSNEQPKYVTAEEIGNIVNAAVTSHLKRSLGSAIDTALKPVIEKMATLSTPPPPSDPEEGKKKGKQDPETLAMAKRLEDMEKALNAERERVVAAERKSREERAFSELRGALEGKVRPEFLDMVSKSLFHLDKRVEVDETGRALFKTTRAPYPGAEPEEQLLPLADGVSDFLRSDSAKAFLPAPNAGAGSSPLPTPKRGAGPVAPPRSSTDLSKPATTDAEKARRAMEREQIALQRLNQKQ